MSDTDINATVNVTEDIYADVDSTAMSAAVIDDGDSIVVPAEVDFGQTLDTELEDNDLIDVPVDESVGIAGDHRVLLHRDAANQHPMSAITGLNETIAGINTALSDRITQVEAETADLDVDMASALLRIGDLQDQVDGNITTWFYAAEPAMNLPPVALDPSNPHDTGWDTIDKKNAHRGDLYYNTLTGYAYRFAYADGDFGWMRITDTDVVKALADAARAQDTADSKRRVFYTTPYPPYDKGDLWVQGTNGDILVCNTSKAAGEAYDFADWAKASKYTDDTVANLAMASANGKNTVYHQDSQPTGGTYKKGDTWFDTDDDYTMYTYDGSVWVKEQFGNEAIKDLSITNSKIQNATIEYSKIKSVDAGKITVGDLSANRIKASVITAVNGSTETSGGSSLKISADKVNIEGATIFTSGRLSTTSLDNAYDANGAASGALADAKDYADGTAADALDDAKGYADGAVSGKADKTDAVYEEQIIYKSAVSGTTSMSGTTTWVTDASGDQNKWTTKRPQYSTSYPVLFVAKQRKTVSDTVTCTTPVKDETTTVIDGGHITTGTIDAARLNVSDIIASGSIAVTSDIPTDVSELSDSSGVIPTDMSDLTDTTGVIPTDLSDLTDTQGVIPDVSGKADKTDAVARTQRIYYRKTSSGAPSANTTWLSTSGTGYGNWSLKIPQMTSGTTKYPYLYTAVQTQTVSQVGGTTCSCSDVLLDDTTTVIDGGTIITGSLNANRIGAGDISADRMKVNSISAINGNTGTVKISAGKVEIDGATTFTAIKSQADAAYDAKGSASAVQTNLNNLEIGGRNLLLDTGTANTWTLSLNSSNYHVHDCYKTYSPVPSIFSADDLVTISFDWSTTGTSGNFRLECGKVTPYTWGTVVNAIGTRSATSNFVDITSSNTSGHAVITFKITSSQASAATTLEWFRIRVDGADMAGKTFTISNAKAERGNKATDWTPAPEDVQAEIDAKKSVHTLNTSYSYTYANILTYSAEGFSSGWNVASSTGVKVGDTARLKVTVSNMSNAPVYIIGTVTAVNSATNITMTSHGLDTTIIDGGNIITNSIGANQIAANAITIGKLDGSAQEQITNRIKASDSKSGNIVTWENMLIDDLDVDIEPIQSLNGYDKPWSGGAGKNKLPTFTTSTVSGVTFTAQTNGSVKVSGTATANDIWSGKSEVSLPAGSYKLNGGISNNYAIRVGKVDGTYINQAGGSDVTFTLDEATTVRVNLRIMNLNGQAVSGTFYPMIRLSSVSDATYAPYSNICPISGYDSVVVSRCGKNLLPKHAVGTGTRTGIAYTYNSDGTIELNGTATATTNITIYNSGDVSQGLQGSYILNGSVGGTLPTYRISARVRDTSAGTTRDVSVSNGDKAITTSASEVINSVYITVYSGVTLSNKVFYPMLRLSSVSDATYEPYQGNTYTTDLSGTRYGGTLDVASGVLTVDRAMVTYDGGEAWTKEGNTWNTSGLPTYYISLNPTAYFVSDSQVSSAISNAVPLVSVLNARSASTPYCATITKGGSTTYIEIVTDITSVTDFKQWLADSPLQFCYPLATPTTVQLTAQEVSALVGTNVLWANSGDVHIELTGVKDYADSISDAAKTATSYITDIDSNNGITIKAVNGATSGSDTTKQNYIKLNADGLDIYQEGTSVAHYGDYARIGKEGEASTIISSNEVIISASDDIDAFRIIPDGNEQTVTKIISANYTFNGGKSCTRTHPAGADAGSYIRYDLKGYTSTGNPTRAYFQIRKGVATTRREVSSPFAFAYSSTTNSVTIYNTGAKSITLQLIRYVSTTISPLTKISGVLTLGNNPNIEPSTIIAIGKGTEDAPQTAFEVRKSGTIYCYGDPIFDFVIEEGEWDFWTYRKWHSGIAECWGTHTATLSHTGSYLGGYAYQTSVNFPSGLFADLPVVTYSAYLGNQFALTGTINNSFSVNSVALFAICNNSGSKTTSWHINAKGKWK